MEKQVNLKNITMLQDKAIIDIGGPYSYLVDFDKFALTKSNFNLSEDGIIYPSNYILWFDSYKEDIDVIEFEIKIDVHDEGNFIKYTIKGFLNMEGEISNRFEVKSSQETIEVYLNQKDCYDTNKIIEKCLNSIISYYKPYVCVLYKDSFSNEIKEYIQ